MGLVCVVWSTNSAVCSPLGGVTEYSLYLYLVHKVAVRRYRTFSIISNAESPSAATWPLETETENLSALPCK